jgi:hypothetical protein
MIKLKTILSGVARAFGISSPEDLRRQKRATSKPAAPLVDLNDQTSQVNPRNASDDRPAKPTQK